MITQGSQWIPREFRVYEEILFLAIPLKNTIINAYHLSALY